MQITQLTLDGTQLCRRFFAFEQLCDLRVRQAGRRAHEPFEEARTFYVALRINSHLATQA